MSGHCSPDYLGWFYVISHPFIYLPQPGDPLRVPSIQQYEEFVDAHMYQQPMAAAAPTEAHIDQHDFGHAVVIFFIFLFFCFVYYLIINHCYVCLISITSRTLQQLMIV